MRHQRITLRLQFSWGHELRSVITGVYVEARFLNADYIGETGMESWEKDIENKQRFEFGKNWAAFLGSLNESRIHEAEKSLVEMLGCDSLSGKRFLDVGCGSGLFSLVARRLGASVHSFDFDPMSVACTAELRNRYFPGDDDWNIESGSALDQNYIESLPAAEIVYSWGVLHHTGDMWTALKNVGDIVPRGGYYFIAIYNDQGWMSSFWLQVKKIYNSGQLGRMLVMSVFVPVFVLKGLVMDLLRPRSPFRRYRDYRQERGMSVFHDWRDWLGGYPFEYSSA